MFAGKMKLFVFGLVIGSTFFMSSCTLPTLGDKGASTPHRAAVSENEPLSNTSSGVQTYTGVLSLSGAVKILTDKREEYYKNNNYDFSNDFTKVLQVEELQGLNNWLTQEKSAIKLYNPKLCYNEKNCEMKTLFEISIGTDEKYYWISDNGEQIGDIIPLYDEYEIDIQPREDTQFSFLIREQGQKKDVVYISNRLFYGDGWLPLVIFDEKNQVFEMYRSDGDINIEFDRTFSKKRKVNDYLLPSPLEGLNEGYDIKKEPLNVQYLDSVGGDQSKIINIILENSPSLRTSLAKVFSVNENDISKIIESLEKNRAIPTLSHMSKEGDLVIFELEWLTFTRLKNMGLPQGKHNYAISKARFCKSFGGPVCESIAIEKLKKVKGAYGDESYSGKYLTGLLLWDYDTINFEKDIVYTLTGDEFQYNNHIQWYSKEKEFNKLEFLSLFEKFRNNDYLGIKSDFEKNKELIPFYPTCCAGKTYFYFEPYRNGIFVLQKGGNGGISYGLSYITYKNGKIYEISKDTGFFIEEDNLYIDSVKTGVAPKDYDKKIIGYFTGVEKNEKLNNLFSLFKIEIDNLYK